MMELSIVNLCVNGTSSALLRRLLYSNKTVRNVPKHEFWIQWSGSVAFVVKNSDPTSFCELVR
jgi:hypothetical protein